MFLLHLPGKGLKLGVQEKGAKLCLSPLGSRLGLGGALGGSGDHFSTGPRRPGPFVGCLARAGEDSQVVDMVLLLNCFLILFL